MTKRRFAPALLALAATPAVAQVRTQILSDPAVAVQNDFGQALEAVRFDAGGGETEWLFVGSHGESASSPGDYPGKVVVYERDGAGMPWVERQILDPHDPGNTGLFGAALLFAEGRLFVGSTYDVLAAPTQGSVRVFEWDSSAWVEVQRLTAPGQPHTSRFGSWLAFDAGTLLVGQNESLDPGIGAVHAFERVGGQWVPVGRLLPEVPAVDERFGVVAAADGLAAVGAWSADHAAGTEDVGRVLLFARGPSGWVERASLSPPSSDPHQLFGHSLALRAGLLYVGAYGSADLGVSWAVHVYDVSSAAPTLLRTIEDPWPGGEGGTVLDVSEDTLLVREWTDVAGLPIPGRNGSVHVFRPADGSEPQVARLTDGYFWSLPIDRRFGQAAALIGSTIVTSATKHGWDWDFGRVYTFEYPSFVELLCFCDTGAPCDNASHRTGCQSERGSSLFRRYGTLAACGSASVSADDLRLQASGITPAGPALLFTGDQEIVGSPAVLGGGLRCAGGNIRRVALDSAMQEEFIVEYGPGLAAAQGWQAGDTRLFQVWSRVSLDPCGSDNTALTNAVRVTFQP